MSKYYVYDDCPRCGGDGQFPQYTLDGEGNMVEVDPSDTVTCTKCNGEGKVKVGWIDEDLTDIIGDILDKCNDIFEQVSE